MGEHKSSRVRTIRLPNELWDRVEADADGLGLTANAVVHRRLTKSFERVPELRKTEEKEQKQEQELVTLP